MSLIAMFGDTLQTKSGDRPTADVLAECDVIGVYFSAHWCPPCRRFTPVLAKAYEQLRAEGKRFEIIFSSSDSDVASFDEYYGEMPWISVPYASRDVSSALSKKFKVKGIPSLVILDRDGNTITTDGRAAIDAPEDFPWTPTPLSKLLEGPFVATDGTSVSAGSLSSKYIGIYFSAHWCPPCKMFTPALAATYKAIKSRGIDNFEVVFVSSDRDQASFNGYHSEMPWLALPFDQRKTKEQLSALFQVSGIPSLVILGPADAAGVREVINGSARGSITGDPEGHQFPWMPAALPRLQDTETIDSIPTVLVLADGCSVEKAASVRAEVEPVASRVRRAAKARGVQIDFAFAAPTDELASRVRDLLHLGDATDVVKVVLLDLSDEGAFYLGADDSTSGDAIETFVTLFEARQLDKMKMSA